MTGLVQFDKKIGKKERNRNISVMLNNPDETYNAYKRFLNNGHYQKAYKCLESLLRQFPDDNQLLDEMVAFCINTWRNPKLARPWLLKVTKKHSRWRDHILLSEIEAEFGDISTAKQYFKTALEIKLSQPMTKDDKKNQKIFSDAEKFIKYWEWQHANEKIEIETPKVPLKTLPLSRKTIGQAKQKTTVKEKTAVKEKAAEKQKTAKKELKENITQEAQLAITNIPTYKCSVAVLPPDRDILRAFQSASVSTLKALGLLLDYLHLTIKGGFDELLCLNAMNGVEHHWYQIETVKKVLKGFHGRVLLCDEVGLGKTIEAGMLIKEYVMRGMAKNVLILTPPALVSQWKEEMSVKFGMEFVTTEDGEFGKNQDAFWKNKYIIASIHTAKGKNSMDHVVKQFFDIVVVDEAHHLKNRATVSWKLVNQLKKKFIYLLTATPVQNNLIELYNLITLLKPGQFKTEKLFKQEYVARGSTKIPANKEKLRELLKDVMVRNTRSAIDIRLPKRFASTYRLEPEPIEKSMYVALNQFLKGQRLKKPLVNLLLREAESCPYALKKSLLNMRENNNNKEIKSIIGLIDNLDGTSKGKMLVDIIKKNPKERVLVFTQFIKSIEYIAGLLSKHGLSFTLFKGDMPAREKDISIARFKDEVPILLSTESGGEGRNMQFCNTIVNFDLPWNPMRIEQRIGRLHRIGQTRDVFIFNLSIKGTVEDYIIDVLDSKINMFEMVIGEIEPILGYLNREDDFNDIIMDIWLKSSSEKELQDGFDMFGKELVHAKKEYLKSKSMDDEIFGEDYEI